MGERQTYLLWQRFTTFQLNLFIIMSYRNIFFQKTVIISCAQIDFPPVVERSHVAGLQRRRCPHLHDSSRQRHKKIATSERNVLGDFFLLHVYIFICLSYILCRVIYNRHATFDNPIVYLKNKTNQTTTATKSQMFVLSLKHQLLKIFIRLTRTCSCVLTQANVTFHLCNQNKFQLS